MKNTTGNTGSIAKTLAMLEYVLEGEGNS